MGRNSAGTVRVSICVKMMLLLPATILIAVAIVGFEFVRSTEDALEERILSGLEAVATAKAHEITSLVEQDFERVALIASRTRLRECLAGLQEDSPQSAQLLREMNQSLSDALHSLEFLQEVSATDPSGTVVASTNPGLIGSDMSASPLFPESKTSFCVGSLEYRNGTLFYDMGAPLAHPHGNGTLGMICRPDSVAPACGNLVRPHRPRNDRRIGPRSGKGQYCRDGRTPAAFA